MSCPDVPARRIADVVGRRIGLDDGDVVDAAAHARRPDRPEAERAQHRIVREVDGRRRRRHGLRCAFGLSKREVSVLLRLLESGGWLTVSGISARSGRDRSVVQRAILSLMRKGIVERDHHNRAGGGYEYVYRAADKKRIKKSILEKRRAFSTMVDESLRRW